MNATDRQENFARAQMTMYLSLKRTALRRMRGMSRKDLLIRVLLVSFVSLVIAPFNSLLEVYHRMPASQVDHRRCCG